MPSTKILCKFFAATLSASTLLVASQALAQEVTLQKSTAGQISITGQGIITATPDMATLSSGVRTDGKTAKNALAANSASMSELINILRNAGIESRDIQTSGFSVQPIYVHSSKLTSNGYSQPAKISGYQVSNNVSVRVRDLDILGTVIDQAVTVGANQINSVTFGVAETADIFEQARIAAILDAKKKATLYTQTLDVSLAKLIQISEYGQTQPQARNFDRAVRMEMSASSMPAPMEAGELAYTMQVNVTWEIAQ